MSNSPAPTNFNWVGDTLTFTLDPVVTGVKIQFQKENDPEWVVLLELESSTSPLPTSCNLPSSWGPKGTIWGATSSGGGQEGWGEPNIQEITNS